MNQVQYLYFTNENYMETIPVYEWNKNHKLKLIISSSLGNIKIASFKYSKYGDIYYFPQNKSEKGFALTQKENQSSYMEFISNDHNYISFHASGIIKGPDYEEKNDGYASFNFRIDNLQKPKALCELYLTIPDMYPKYEQKDETQSLICDIELPDNLKDISPMIFFEIMNLEHFKKADIFKWEKKYYKAFALTLETKEQMILLIGVALINSPIPNHNIIKITVQD